MALDPGGRIERRRGRRRRRFVLTSTVLGALLTAGVVAGAVALVTKKDDTPTRHVAQQTNATTSSSTTTTTVPTSTTVVPKSTNPVVALAQQYDGYYEGTFANTTFSTTGNVTLELRIDPNAGTLEVTSDLNGDLFGGGAKDLKTIHSTIKLSDPNAAVVTDTKSFGKVTGQVDPSLALTLDAPDVPDPKVQSFQLTGRLRSDRAGFDATFHVVFENGKTADGTITVTCATRGQRASQVPTLCTPPAA